MRVVLLRSGLVLAREGGILRKILPPFRLGLGGKIGSGAQWMPWIHLDDEIGLIRHAMEHESVKRAAQPGGARAGHQRRVRARARRGAGAPDGADRARVRAAAGVRDDDRRAPAGQPAGDAGTDAGDRVRISPPAAARGAERALGQGAAAARRRPPPARPRHRGWTMRVRQQTPLPPPAPADFEARVAERTRDLEAARAELEARSRRNEEVDRLKNAFIANMSHEIRTPLNSVLALTELLRDGVAGPLTVDQRKYLQVIERNGQGLLHLINDVLDLSRIEAGHLEMDAQDVDLAPQVEAVVEALAPLAAAKKLDLMVKLPPIAAGRARRRRSLSADPDEPRRQRHQVHRGGRPGLDRRRGAHRYGHRGRHRHGRRDPRRLSRQGLPRVLPGRSDAGAPAGGDGAGPGDRAAAGAAHGRRHRRRERGLPWLAVLAVLAARGGGQGPRRM